MAISSREAADAHFVNGGEGYNSVQVDTYVARVAATLTAHERDLAEARAEIGRLEHALDLAHVVQSTRDVPAAVSSGEALGQALAAAGADVAEPGSDGAAAESELPVEPWDEIARWADERRREETADAEFAATQEEVRRLRGVADALGTEAAVARHGIQAGSSPAAQEAAETRARLTIEAAEIAATDLLESSLLEAQDLVVAAETSALGITRAAELEARDLNQRTAQLRTALREAGTRFEELAGGTRTEIKVLEDFIDLEMHSVEELAAVEPKAADTIDLREEAAETPTVSNEPTADVKEAPGFYERRLAGLRERLENI
jgi:cell division septum initiation protein DivIVA